MKASISVKPATDKYGAISTASLFGSEEFPLVRVPSPAIDSDPNTTSLAPTSPRVLPFPPFGNVATTIYIASILGGTSLIGRFWCYDTASGKWLPIGGLITITTGAAQGSAATGMRTRKFYWQTTTVNGVVTDLFYGAL